MRRGRESERGRKKKRKDRWSGGKTEIEEGGKNERGRISKK